ncbi:MAG: DUF3524 domain-containing protein [Desulfobacula sp.]|nr:DUF3524 domain-containing protein [Desulfobacula sp.]
MKILYLEPFFGGSHKDFALGFKENSAHDVELITLPGRFWKWRMRGAALYFFEQVGDLNRYDAIFATDMMNLTDFIGLAKGPVPPILMYFHENQLSYPLPLGGRRDIHTGFTNITSALAADKVLFNSKYHFDAFIAAAGDLIGRSPDYPPHKIVQIIREKTQIAYPGCRFETGPIEFDKKTPSLFSNQALPRHVKPPLIIWNHRWEYDKNPEMFFDALEIIKDEGIPFLLALLGEKPGSVPEIFLDAKEEFESRIVIFGYAKSRQEYISWLKKGSIIVSCANQENFGISVVEAVRYGCLPLLPDRLSYPELIPKEMHSKLLYQSKKDFIGKLRDMLVNSESNKSLQIKMSEKMERFAWCTRVRQYDKALENLQN